MTQHRLLGLEVIRFVAALAILITHYGQFFYVGMEKVGFVPELQPFYPVLWLVYDYGFWGVHVFWTVSGFIFFYKYRDLIAERHVGGPRFFLLRFSRLYPLHFATLLLVAALQVLYSAQHDVSFEFANNDAYHFVLQLFMASNWGLEAGPSFNAPIWSVSVEILVYVIFFALTRFLGGSVLVTFGVLALCAATKILHIWHPVFDCLMFFYLGVVAATLFVATRETTLGRWLDRFSLAAVFAIPVAVLVSGVHAHRHFELLFAMSCAPGLIFVAARDWRISPRIGTIIAAFGNMTYSSYLLHFPMQMAAVMFIGSNTDLFYNPAFFIGYIVAVCAAARLCYVAFELPWQKSIRHRLLPEAGRGAALSAG